MQQVKEEDMCRLIYVMSKKRPP